MQWNLMPCVVIFHVRTVSLFGEGFLMFSWSSKDGLLHQWPMSHVHCFIAMSCHAVFHVHEFPYDVNKEDTLGRFHTVSSNPTRFLFAFPTVLKLTIFLLLSLILNIPLFPSISRHLMTSPRKGTNRELTENIELTKWIACAWLCKSKISSKISTRLKLQYLKSIQNNIVWCDTLTRVLFFSASLLVAQGSCPAGRNVWIPWSWMNGWISNKVTSD